MRSLAFLSFALITTPSLFAENWPQWRGPKNDGHSQETNLPGEWSPDKNIRWKCPLPGPGSSTPCIWKDSIFITCMKDGDVRLMCIGTDGHEKWSKVLGHGNVKTMRDEGGNLASGSCSTDGERVYCLVGSGMLAAFDFQGEKVWSHDLGQEYGDFTKTNIIQFGGHWTPVLFQGVLYVTVMHRQAQKLIAYNAKTGAKTWSVDRESDAPKGVESHDVYASPFIWDKGDKSLVLVHGNDYCTAHRLDNGSEVWRVADLNPKDKYNRTWRAVSSPLATPDLVIVPSCKRGVTVGVDPNLAAGTIKPGAPGEKWRIARDTPDVPSPLLHDGIVYLMGEQGMLMAHDAKTGKQFYEERITNMRHRSNPLMVDGKLFLMGREGTCVVVAAGKTFNKLHENKLPDTFTASIAVSNGVIYLRGWNNLYAIAK
jgi:outer membrane protein assembly factor BamB